jgi:hypothetical protein
MSKVYFLCFLIPTDFEFVCSKVISSMFSKGYAYLTYKTKLLLILFGFNLGFACGSLATYAQTCVQALHAVLSYLSYPSTAQLVLSVCSLF